MNITKADRVMSLKVGHELDVDGRTWFRIDTREFKVHKTGTEPDSPESCTSFVPRTMDDVEEELARNAKTASEGAS